jgi:hypothetical protein
MSKEQTDNLFNNLHQCLGITEDIDTACGFIPQTAAMLLASSIPTCTGVTMFRMSVCYLLVILILYAHGLYCGFVN